MTNYYDSILLDNLKQEYCHLNLDKCGAMQKSVIIMKPGKRYVQYTIQVILSKLNDNQKIILMVSFIRWVMKQ